MSERAETAREIESDTTGQAERRTERRHELWLKALGIIGRLAGQVIGQ